MQIQTKITSQGQVSVPASVRRALGLTPGSVMEWVQDGNRVTVQRAAQHNTMDVHGALFGEGEAGSAPIAKTLDELKQGIRQRMIRRHARG